MAHEPRFGVSLLAVNQLYGALALRPLHLCHKRLLPVGFRVLGFVYERRGLSRRSILAKSIPQYGAFRQ